MFVLLLSFPAPFSLFFFIPFFKNTSGKAKETGEVAKGFVRNTFRLFKWERLFIMSQREVGLGEEGRFLKMYKMWEDCWTKLKLKQIHVSFNSRQKKSRWCGSFWQQKGDLELDLFNSVVSLLLTSAQHTPAITRFQYY